MTYDPNQRFARFPVSVAPSPATSGGTVVVDVHNEDPFASVLAPFYVLLRPAVDAHSDNAEIALATATAAGTRTGVATIEVVRDGSPGRGSVAVAPVVQGGGGSNEQQSITVVATGGTYPLTFMGATTAGLAYNANDAAIQTALNGLTSISNYTAVDIADVQLGGDGVNAKQSIAVVASGGTYTLALDGVASGAIAWNANDAAKQTALEGIVGVGNVVVSGGVATFQGDYAGQPVSQLVPNTGSLTGSGSVTVSGGVVTFGGGLLANRDVPLITATTSSLTNTANAANEQVRVVILADAGTFTLTFGGNTTAATNWNAAASTVKSRLEALASIGVGNIDVTGDAGGPYLLEFKNALGSQNVGAVTANAASLTLNIRTLNITRAQKGSTARAVVVGDTLEVATVPDYSPVPVTLSANQNDWTPTGLVPAAAIAVTLGGAGDWTVTGLAGGAPGRRMTITCEPGGNSLTLSSEDGASLFNNRFSFPANVPVILRPLDAVNLVYDGALSRWVLDSGTPVASISAVVALSSVAMPQITSNQNDYAGLAPYGPMTTVWDISSDAPRDITGIVAPGGGSIPRTARPLVLHNYGSFPITLRNQSSSSAADNRFLMDGDYVLDPNASVLLVYDTGVFLGWRRVGGMGVTDSEVFSFFMGVI